jgi:hypothetical protein
VFKRNFPIHKLFERSCELGLWRLTADKIGAIFGTRINRRYRGKLATVIDQIEHGQRQNCRARAAYTKPLKL